LINDNTDFSINQLLINNLTIDKKYNLNNPNININFNNNNKETSSQIINIININGGNYSMDQTKKRTIKNIPRTDLSSIKECAYDTSYMGKQPHLQKKNIKNSQYEIDYLNNFNIIKQCKTKINKINRLPNKKSNNKFPSITNNHNSLKSGNSNIYSQNIPNDSNFNFSKTNPIFNFNPKNNNNVFIPIIKNRPIEGIKSAKNFRKRRQYNIYYNLLILAIYTDDLLRIAISPLFPMGV